jgi:L-histidine N-alpha-methyltransferase
MGRTEATIERARPRGDEGARMAAEVREGLARRPLPSLPCKYFYDDVGSDLFEQITRLPEYYQTRTEERLLERIADEVIARAAPVELMELGSGTGRKIRLLLDAMARRDGPRRLTLLDISEHVLEDSARRLAAAYPGLSVRGVVGDFQEDLREIGPAEGRMAVFFAGTIGNLYPEDVPGFLRDAAGTLAPGGRFLVGLDLVKDPARLHAAYNDAAGVTARFNRNILAVMNRRLGADFDPSAFEHVAFYDRERAWIEMRLRATRPVRVRVPAADVVLDLPRGGEIRTEVSCKYTRASFAALLAGTGLAVDRWYEDPDRLFALALLVRPA